MRWKKLGKIFSPSSTHPKLISHAANPLAVHLSDDIYRVFYSGRDAHSRSSIGFVDVNILTREAVHAPNVPVFEHGVADSFYSDGVSIGNLYAVNDTRYIGFMGWQVRDNQHWCGDIGRLRMDNEALTLDPQTAWLTKDGVTDPISLSYPWVIRKDDGTYHMWYGSTLTWDAGNGEMAHVIHQAISLDGHRWKRLGLAVPYMLGVAQAFSRPTVLQDAMGYHMWFSYRSGKGEKYRIGYALSGDSFKWELRLSDSGIAPSSKGWDNEMICYPFVFTHGKKHYMLYNGNSYGATGFGLAIREDA